MSEEKRLFHVSVEVSGSEVLVRKSVVLVLKETDKTYLIVREESKDRGAKPTRVVKDKFYETRGEWDRYVFGTDDESEIDQRVEEVLRRVLKINESEMDYIARKIAHVNRYLEGSTHEAG